MIGLDDIDESERKDDFRLPVGVRAGARWVAAMAGALHAYEATDVDDRARMNAFVALGRLFPDLDFPVRAEPRDTFVDAIARGWAADPAPFGAALSFFVSSAAPDLELAVFETALSILADAHILLPEGDLFIAQSLLSNWPGDRSVDDGLRSLVLVIQPSNWRAIVSLIERATADKKPHPRVLQAGLESVAKYTPSHLGAVLVRLGEQLEMLSASALAHILERIAANATPYVCALAMIELDPLRSPRLLAAAFGDPAGRFRFSYDPVEAEEDTVVHVSDGAELLPLSDDRVGKDLQVWIALTSTSIAMVRRRMTSMVLVVEPSGMIAQSNRETRIDRYFRMLFEGSGA